VARHFELEAKRQDEEETLHNFLSSYDRAMGKALAYEPAAKRARGGQGSQGHDDGGGGGGPGGPGGRTSASLPGGPGLGQLAAGGGGGGGASGASARRSAAGYGPAKVGEQVAAMTEDDDGGAQWILAVVTKYYVAEVRDTHKHTEPSLKYIYIYMYIYIYSATLPRNLATSFSSPRE
jgi:hypothetical protein